MSRMISRLRAYPIRHSGEGRNPGPIATTETAALDLGSNPGRRVLEAIFVDVQSPTMVGDNASEIGGELRYFLFLIWVSTAFVGVDQASTFWFEENTSPIVLSIVFIAANLIVLWSYTLFAEKEAVDKKDPGFLAVFHYAVLFLFAGFVLETLRDATSDTVNANPTLHDLSLWSVALQFSFAFVRHHKWGNRQLSALRFVLFHILNCAAFIGLTVLINSTAETASVVLMVAAIFVVNLLVFIAFPFVAGPERRHQRDAQIVVFLVCTLSISLVYLPLGVFERAIGEETTFETLSYFVGALFVVQALISFFRRYQTIAKWEELVEKLGKE